MYKVQIKEGVKLTDYAAYAFLLLPLPNFQTKASSLVKALKGQRIWMINSTRQGGGVAEMMPRLISIMRQLGLDAHWLVMESEDPSFFAFTKKLHNLIHGTGEAGISSSGWIIPICKPNVLGIFSPLFCKSMIIIFFQLLNTFLKVSQEM